MSYTAVSAHKAAINRRRRGSNTSTKFSFGAIGRLPSFDSSYYDRYTNASGQVFSDAGVGL